MDFSQTQLTAYIDAAIKKYSGKYVADQQGNYVGECLSLVKKIYGDDILHIQMPGAVGGYAWGDGYWRDFPVPLPTYFNKLNYVLNRQYPEGSLVTYAPTHHIAIWLRDNHDGTHMVFEQNADPDHSPAHLSTRANNLITGILTPKVKGTNMTTAELGHEISRMIFLCWGRNSTQAEVTTYINQVQGGTRTLENLLLGILNDPQATANISKLRG